jgi:hypothetical protein
MTLVIWQIQCSPPAEPDVTPPVVLVLYPYEGSVISGSVNVSVDASDDGSIKRIWYYLDGDKKGQAEESHAIFELNVSEFADDQTHIIYAAAEDRDGNIGYSPQISVIISDSDDIIPPVVQIVNPLDGQVVQDTVLVVAAADDNQIVREVAFFVDGDSVFSDLHYPYEYAWPVVDFSDSTEHTVFAKAFDESGNWAVSSPVTVTIFPRSSDRDPPTVSLLYPIPETTISGIVNVWVDANDNVRVNKVEFYVDGLPFETDHSAPWGFVWDTRPLADGNEHSLYIKAYDTAGNIGTAGPFTFFIN